MQTQSPNYDSGVRQCPIDDGIAVSQDEFMKANDFINRNAA